MRYQVIFQPSGRRGDIEAGETLLEASRQLGVDIEAICGQNRTCGKCKVRIMEGTYARYGISSSVAHLSPQAAEEVWLLADPEREQGYRLACIAAVQGDLFVFVPEESRGAEQVIRKAHRSLPIIPDPAIRKYFVEMSPPSLADPRGDEERLLHALEKRHKVKGLTFDYPALLDLPNALRKEQWRTTATVWMGREIQRIEPGQKERSLGLAVDVGTTTVAGYLCGLDGGRVLATSSLMNPQVSYGEDVMARITYAMTHPEGLDRLHNDIIGALNQLALQVTQKIGHCPSDIAEIVLVGNTAMHHFLLKLNTEPLGLAPFPPAIQRACDVKARDLGLKVHPAANVHILPNEAGFVGADNVGVLIAEEPYLRDEIALIIDIGTNGELVLGNRKRLLSASCATGPALEGAHIQFGMRAAPGAIEKITIDPQSREANYQVIGQEQPGGKEIKAKGICGSGVIDGVAELFRTGILLRSGAFNQKVSTPRLRKTENRWEFVVAWAEETSIGKDITLSQNDVRAVQLAKAALYTGAKLLLRKLGVEKPDVVILAGAFGSYIDKRQALTIGLFPDMDLENVRSVGNAAGDGARWALLDVKKRREAEEMAQKVEYLELTLEPDFEREFMKSMHFPHMEDPFPHVRALVQG
ncbi:MAG: ASKHA domain-containing protein [Dehalococcoidia bacterium]